MKESNLAAWDLAPLQGLADVDMETMQRHLVAWAILAANSHNSQPWRFVLRPRTGVIDVVFDEAGLTPASDPTHRQSTIGIGCAVENLRAAATAYGYSPLVTYAAQSVTNGVLATVKLSRSGKAQLTEQDLVTLGAIRDRRMNRSKYLSQPIPEDFVRGLQENAAACEVNCVALTDRSTRLAISELQYMADRAVIAFPAFRHELQRFFLRNDSNAPRGMPGATFGLSDEMTAEIVRDLGTPGLFNADWSNGFASAGRDGIRSAPLIAVVTSERDSTPAWLRVGAFFQRTAVQAQSRGLSVAVHAALIESMGLNALLRARLRTLARPILVFRVGFASQVRPHAPRLSSSMVCQVE